MTGLGAASDVDVLWQSRRGLLSRPTECSATQERPRDVCVRNPHAGRRGGCAPAPRKGVM
eukprot:1334151-Lingulodinium_polyedra.AAC.1